MKRFLQLLVSYFLMFEGVDHFVVSTVAIVGLIHTHTFGFFAWFTPCFDYLMGAGTLVSGLYLRRRKHEQGH